MNAYQPLDVIAFKGARRNPISGLIELITENREVGGYSHVGIMRQPDKLIQSTRSATFHGVQTTPLVQVLAEYPRGSEAWWFALTPESRALSGALGLEAFYALCGRSDGFVHYSIAELFRFLALPEWLDAKLPDPSGEVCSVWVATALETARVTRGVDPRTMKPNDIVALADPARVGGPLLKPGVRIL